MRVDLWVVFVWPVAVFIVGTALVALSKWVWRKFSVAWTRKRRDAAAQKRLDAAMNDPETIPIVKEVLRSVFKNMPDKK